MQALQTKQVTRIILTRPAVEAGERLGFLPGTLHEKIDPYLRPLHDALHDMMDPEAIPKLMQAGVIEVAPLAYMRGSHPQRRVHHSRRGAEHHRRTDEDVPHPARLRVQDRRDRRHHPGRSARWARSGLRAATEILGDIDGIHFAVLDSSDVVRHRLVSDIVDAYDRFESTRNGDLPLGIGHSGGRSSRARTGGRVVSANNGSRMPAADEGTT